VPDEERCVRLRGALKSRRHAASALNHPNIVTVFAIEQDGDDDFIAMEYVEGEPLDAVVARGPVPVARLVGARGRDRR
jgi:serine/threonine protein kinase